MRNIFFALAVLFFSSGCNSIFNMESSKGNMELASGIVETETLLPGGIGKTDMKITFDHHGARKLTEMTTTMTMAGSPMSSQSFMLIKGGYMYSWMSMSNKGNKLKLDASEVSSAVGLDFTNITDGMKAKYGFKETGTEVIGGKSTAIFSFGLDKMKGRVFLWKGIPLKSEIQVDDKTIITNFKNLQENPDISSSVFDLPSGIEFTEVADPRKSAQ